MVKLSTVRPRMEMAKAGSRMVGLKTPAASKRIRGSSLQVTIDRIMKRDNGVCQCARCKADGVLRIAHQIDHIVPIWKGGREEDGNRQAINRDCHVLKSAREAKERASLGVR